MELFGILLSAPFLLVASVVYAILVGKANSRWPFWGDCVLWISFAIIVLFLIEVIAVASAGTIAVRETIGPMFYPVHTILFFVIVPCIVNVMRIQQRFTIITKLYVIGPLCGFLGFFIVLFQYAVFEALFGVDGMGGPYSLP
jgi:hypothetical protein